MGSCRYPNKTEKYGDVKKEVKKIKRERYGNTETDKKRPKDVKTAEKSHTNFNQTMIFVLNLTLQTRLKTKN